MRYHLPTLTNNFIYFFCNVFLSFFKSSLTIIVSITWNNLRYLSIRFTLNQSKWSLTVKGIYLEYAPANMRAESTPQSSTESRPTLPDSTKPEQKVGPPVAVKPTSGGRQARNQSTESQF